MGGRPETPYIFSRDLNTRDPPIADQTFPIIFRKFTPN
jgi:hypothetical protein